MMWRVIAGVKTVVMLRASKCQFLLYNDTIRDENRMSVPCDGSLDRIVIPLILNNEPERYSNRVLDPNRAVEVKIVTEHELPLGQRLALDG
jgi:hypothetical protein